MDRRDWCISTTRIPVFRKRQRCTRSRNKVREGPGKTWLQVRHPIKHDGRCSPKTKQTNKQTHQDSKNTLLVLPAFLSVPQYLPQAVYPGPLFHSSVTLASALPHIFMLCFLPPPCLSGHQETDSECYIYFSVCCRKSTAAGWHLPSPSSLNFPFMFTPCAIPLFHALMCFCHNINKPTACRVLCSPSVPVWLENHLLCPVPLRPCSAQKCWKTDRNCELC